MAETAENIVDFKGGKAAVAPAPALGMSVVTNMPGDRQFTLQCFVASDAPLDEQNGLADRMFRMVDRQKARYEIEGIVAELTLHNTKLAEMEEDYARTEGEFQRAQDTLRTQIAVCAEAEKDARDMGYSAHVSGGRRGDYHPKGHVLQSINTSQAQAKMYKDQLAKNVAEREKYILSIETNRQRFKDEIKRRQDTVAALEAKLKG